MWELSWAIDFDEGGLPMKTIIVTGLFILLSSAASATGQEKPAEIIEFQTKMGVVTFRHGDHGTLRAKECTECHHTYTGEKAVQPCADCHLKTSTKAPSLFKAIHMKCSGCHEYTVKMGDPAGPLKKQCKLCHVKKK